MRRAGGRWLWVVWVPRLQTSILKTRLLIFRSILFVAGTEAWLWRGETHTGGCPLEPELGEDWPCSRVAPRPRPHGSLVLVTPAAFVHGRWCSRVILSWKTSKAGMLLFIPESEPGLGRCKKSQVLRGGAVSGT